MTLNPSPLPLSSTARSLTFSGRAAADQPFLQVTMPQERALSPAEVRIERRRARLALGQELLRRAGTERS